MNPRLSVTIAALLLVAHLAQPARSQEIRLDVKDLPEGASLSAFVAGGDAIGAVNDAGLWKFANLSPGTYSIEIKAGGLDVIGVDMRVKGAQGGPVQTGPLPEAVETTIREFFEHTKDFFDERRMPLVAGAGDRAVALVENSRKGDTTTYGAAKGQVFFRLDLWDFEKSFGAWQKSGSRVFLRRMVDAREFASLRRIYSTELGGIDLAPGQVRTIEYDFPQDSSAAQEESK